MNKKISLKEAISIGIGGMVGGRIFAIRGLEVNLAQGGTPIDLLIIAVATLILVNVLHLESISTEGSIGFLLIFGFVNLVEYRLSKEKK